MKNRVEKIWTDVEAIRAGSPLIHNITNYVVMNNTANALLAIGASPAMVHTPEESGEMAAISSALVVNIGTLSPNWVAGMEQAMQSASAAGVPIVFDPVAVGATAYRRESCRRLLDAVTPDIIRGNGSEIIALGSATGNSKGRGPDSTATSDEAVDAAAALSEATGAVVVVSGAYDYVIHKVRIATVKNGTSVMTRITGMGCTASAICGAFAAVNRDPFEAAANAMFVMSICGEIALSASKGSGSFAVEFIDALCNLTKEQITQYIKE